MPLLSHNQMYASNGLPTFAPLIYELCMSRSNAQRPSDKAIFTIRQEKEGLISLKKLFVSHTSEDPTEVSFAEAVFGDVGYWLRMREQKEISKLLPPWREEADVIRKAKAFQVLITEVTHEGKNAFAASKYLIEEPWKGRTKAAVKAKRETTQQAVNLVKDDIEVMKEFLN